MFEVGDKVRFRYDVAKKLTEMLPIVKKFRCSIWRVTSAVPQFEGSTVTLCYPFYTLRCVNPTDGPTIEWLDADNWLEEA